MVGLGVSGKHSQTDFLGIAAHGLEEEVAQVEVFLDELG
jgi:hypothetical protein